MNCDHLQKAELCVQTIFTVYIGSTQQQGSAQQPLTDMFKQFHGNDGIYSKTQPADAKSRVHFFFTPNSLYIRNV